MNTSTYKMPGTPDKAQRGPRARRREARPGELTAAALSLFVEKGYAATKLDEVALRAGVSKGTLYLYFTSKEALFKAVIEEGMLPVLEEAEKMAAKFEGSSADLLELLIRGWWERVGKTPTGGLIKLMLAEAANFPDVARFYHDHIMQRGTSLLKTVLMRGVASGEFRPVDLDATVRIVFSPMLLRVVWLHSFELCGCATVNETVFMKNYLDLIKSGLRA